MAFEPEVLRREDNVVSNVGTGNEFHQTEHNLGVGERTCVVLQRGYSRVKRGSRVELGEILLPTAGNAARKIDRCSGGGKTGDEIVNVVTPMLGRGRLLRMAQRPK